MVNQQTTFDVSTFATVRDGLARILIILLVVDLAILLVLSGWCAAKRIFGSSGPPLTTRAVNERERKERRAA